MVGWAEELQPYSKMFLILKEYLSLLVRTLKYSLTGVVGQKCSLKRKQKLRNVLEYAVCLVLKMSLLNSTLPSFRHIAWTLLDDVDWVLLFDIGVILTYSPSYGTLKMSQGQFRCVNQFVMVASM